jgi:RHS repeat-associated protein
MGAEIDYSLAVDVNGTIVGSELYKAWGGGRYTYGSIETSFKYTGQREAEAGLYFYNARWYDPELGRFIQADTIIPEPGNPMAWDRYAYGYNNPVNSIDPSGHKACSGWDENGNCVVDEEFMSTNNDYNFKHSRKESVINKIEKIISTANWVLQDFTDTTIYKTSGWPYRTSFRIFADTSLEFDNNSPVSFSNREFSVGNIGYSDSGWSIETENYSISPIPDIINGGGIQYVHKFPEIELGNTHIQSELGFQGILRPGNDAMTGVAVALTVGAVQRPDVAVIVGPKVVEKFGKYIRPVLENMMIGWMRSIPIK